MKPLAEALKSKVGMRMISLRAIEEAIAKSKDKNFSDVPQEILFLAGIQRVEFVFLYPGAERHRPGRPRRRLEGG